MPSALPLPLLTLAVGNVARLLEWPAGGEREEQGSALSALWGVCSKVKENLEHGQRLENLSWRLWYRSAHPPSGFVLPSCRAAAAAAAAFLPPAHLAVPSVQSGRTPVTSDQKALGPPRGLGPWADLLLLLLLLGPEHSGPAAPSPLQASASVASVPDATWSGLMSSFPCPPPRSSPAQPAAAAGPPPPPAGRVPPSESAAPEPVLGPCAPQPYPTIPIPHPATLAAPDPTSQAPRPPTPEQQHPLVPSPPSPPTTAPIHAPERVERARFFVSGSSDDGSTVGESGDVSPLPPPPPLLHPQPQAPVRMQQLQQLQPPPPPTHPLLRPVQRVGSEAALSREPMGPVPPTLDPARTTAPLAPEAALRRAATIGQRPLFHAGGAASSRNQGTVGHAPTQAYGVATSDSDDDDEEEEEDDSDFDSDWDDNTELALEKMRVDRELFAKVDLAPTGGGMVRSRTTPALGRLNRAAGAAAPGAGVPSPWATSSATTSPLSAPSASPPSPGSPAAAAAVAATTGTEPIPRNRSLLSMALRQHSSLTHVPSAASVATTAVAPLAPGSPDGQDPRRSTSALPLLRAEHGLYTTLHRRIAQDSSNPVPRGVAEGGGAMDPSPPRDATSPP